MPGTSAPDLNRLAAKAQPRKFMLTFDDGPLPGKTDRVLETVSKLTAPDGSRIKAAFFMLGDAPQYPTAVRHYFAPYEVWVHKGSMQQHRALVQRVLAEGHFVGNHTAHHAWIRWPWFWSRAALKQEISEWEKHAGVPMPGPKLFRPPHLIENEALTAASTELGYQTVSGYTVGDASPGSDVSDVKARILKIFADPKIPTDKPVVLIFHDVISTTYENLGEIVSYLQGQGHTLVHFDPQKAAKPVQLPAP